MYLLGAFNSANAEEIYVTPSILELSCSRLKLRQESLISLSWMSASFYVKTPARNIQLITTLSKWISVTRQVLTDLHLFSCNI